MLWNKNIIKYTSSYNGFTYKDYYFPLLRYSGRIRKIGNLLKLGKNYNVEHSYRKNGYKGMERKWNGDLAQAKLNKSNYVINIDSSSVKLFDQFLKDTKENNIKVILIYTPEYIDGQKFVKNRNEILKIYKNFTKKYNLSFLDYSNNNLSFRKDLFYNSSHLNKIGSEIFTKILSSDLKALTHNNGYHK